MADENNNGLSMKMMIIMMVTIIIITGIFSYVFMSFLAPGNGSQEEEVVKEESESKIGPTYTLGDFVVNLSGSGGYQFIKAHIVVEVDESDVVAELDKRNPQIRDLIILTLREQKIEDIEEPGAHVIKNRLKTKLNQILNSGQITNIWFTQLVVQ